MWPKAPLHLAKWRAILQCLTNRRDESTPRPLLHRRLFRLRDDLRVPAQAWFGAISAQVPRRVACTQGPRARGAQNPRNERGGYRNRALRVVRPLATAAPETVDKFAYLQMSPI